MTKAFVEPRPTAVTVIAWVWIVLGAVMLLSVSGVLIMQFVAPLPDPSELPDDQPFAAVWRYLPVLAVGEAIVAVVGIVAGVRFLKLEKWARAALEVTSWILLAGLLVFVIGWIVNALAIGDGAGGVFRLVFVVSGVMSAVIYGAPIGLMIHHLRSDRVRRAVG